MKSKLMSSIVLSLFLLLSIGARPAQAAEVPVIAAASDLQFALEDIARRFTQDTGRNVKLSFGSSGNFFRQISQGGPFELFMSADEQYALTLAEQGRAIDQGVLYALGRLVLFAPEGSPLAPDADLKGVKEALEKGQLKKFAIANPEHAPYGRAAQQVLQTLGLWDDLRAHLVLGENVSQAAQFAASGAAESGIFAYALALSPKLKAQGRFVLLPETLHQPLRQRMVLLKPAGETAKAFYAYLQQPAARTIFEQYGFILPQ
ncbi:MULTISPECIES: molybdate ABC transporter substrate-binding protein [Methylobacter]|uniref:molybdate ABC transporter substrate-binding protein n=1 Tax=Methylobacter TaxID=429 RepID=UPI000379EC29|nr:MULTISPECIES: molybdate ABC transporter substrate-binding protein [Methylobacter]